MMLVDSYKLSHHYDDHDVVIVRMRMKMMTMIMNMTMIMTMKSWGKMYLGKKYPNPKVSQSSGKWRKDFIDY